MLLYFNPRPPWGGRLRRGDQALHTHHFNPRPPWGGRHHAERVEARPDDFNPRPPWGGRPGAVTRGKCYKLISIHALRGEGDIAETLVSLGLSKISIHALRGEGDNALFM